MNLHRSLFSLSFSLIGLFPSFLRKCLAYFSGRWKLLPGKSPRVKSGHEILWLIMMFYHILWKIMIFYDNSWIVKKISWPVTTKWWPADDTVMTHDDRLWQNVINHDLSWQVITILVKSWHFGSDHDNLRLIMKLSW